MNHGIALGAAADGSPVIIKSGRRERATRLRREAAVLHAARHPRVVEVVSLVDEDDAIELALAQVPGRTLLDHPPLSAPDLATLFASLAATVADLHQVGVTHGNLGAEHLILDRDSRPTICGFGNGVVWEDESDDRRRAESIDTISMGRLLDHELTRSIDDVVIDDREPTVIALRHIADLADSASTSHLVTASQIARRLGELTDANATDAPTSADTNADVM